MGNRLLLRLAMKPISTLMSPLATVDLASGQPAKAVSERSDVTAVPAMGVIAEAVMALVLADAMLEKFGGDSLVEMRRNYDGYVAVAGFPLARAESGEGGLMPRHIVLVGLPGAGKSSVGKLVAEALNTFVIDIDALLVREMGMPVSQIIGMVGEPRFREMERDAVKAAQARDPCVIVPGRGVGGTAGPAGRGQASWPGHLPADACRPTALKRCEQGEARPLLAGVDPSQRMQALFEEREPFYKQAHHQINTENTPPEAVAAEVMALARQHGGWFARAGS